MTSKWDVYTRRGLDLASTTTSLGFSAVKSGTRLGFRIARGIADTAVGLTTSVVDHALFGGGTVLRPVAGLAVHSVFDLAEQLALAPIRFSEYITSTSLIAAHSSINILSVIFPGSNDASFSLVSFITLVRREWSYRDGSLPNGNYGLTQVARAIVAWVALQGVTQEWQEKRWFRHLEELDVMEKETVGHERPVLQPLGHSHIRVTSDVIFPGHAGPQIISADIGKAPSYSPVTTRSRNSTISSISSPVTTTVGLPPLLLSRPPSLQHIPSPTTPTLHLRRSFSHQSLHLFPTTHAPGQLPLDELKSTLRRLSKMVLAGYGGASLLFFGVMPYPRDTQKEEAREKRDEEKKLEVAVDAAEAEAAGERPSTSYSQPQPKYAWWDLLLGKHDQEIFEQSALSDEGEERKKQARATERARKDKMKATAVVGTEHLMPRFWVLTDYNRGQVVLVIRGTMSLNEIAVDLTCHAESFHPAQTQELDIDEEDDIYERREPEKSKQSTQGEKSSPYHVHSGMLRMAKAMGEIGKPVQLAVQEALSYNPGFDLVLCGHSLGAGVAAILGMMWADPSTCLTVHSSGLPIGRRVYVYCFAPPSLTDAKLSRLATNLVTSFVYSNDIVSRLSLGSVRDLRNAALWLCEAEDGKHGNGGNGEKPRQDGWSAVTSRARRWKEAHGNTDRSIGGSNEDMNWLVAVRKTLEANMRDQDMYPPGRVLWGMRDSDLHPSHRKNGGETSQRGNKDKLRLFEVSNVEKVFGQIVFARNMLTAHLPNQYDRVLQDLL